MRRRFFKNLFFNFLLTSLVFGQSGLFLIAPQRVLAQPTVSGDAVDTSQSQPVFGDTIQPCAANNQRIQIIGQELEAAVQVNDKAKIAKLNSEREFIKFIDSQMYECGVSSQPAQAPSCLDATAELQRAEHLVQVFDKRLADAKAYGVVSDDLVYAKPARAWLINKRIPDLRARIELVQCGVSDGERCSFIQNKIDDLVKAIDAKKAELEVKKYSRQAKQLSDERKVLEAQRDAWLRAQKKIATCAAPKGVAGGLAGELPVQPPTSPVSEIVSGPKTEVVCPPSFTMEEMLALESKLRNALKKSGSVGSPEYQKVVNDFIGELKANPRIAKIFITEKGSIYFLASPSGPSWRFKTVDGVNFEPQPVASEIHYLKPEAVKVYEEIIAKSNEIATNLKTRPEFKDMLDLQLKYQRTRLAQLLNNNANYVADVSKLPDGALPLEIDPEIGMYHVGHTIKNGCSPIKTPAAPPLVVEPPRGGPPPRPGRGGASWSPFEGGGLKVGPTPPMPPQPGQRGFQPIRDVAPPTGQAPPLQPLVGGKDLGSGAYQPLVPAGPVSAQDYAVGCLGGGGASSQGGSFESLNFALENLDLLDGDAFAKLQSDQLRYGTIDPIELFAPDKSLFTTDSEGRINVFNNEGKKVGSIFPDFSREENDAFNKAAQKIVDSSPKPLSITEQDVAFREAKSKLQVQSGRAAEVVRAHNAKRAAYIQQGIKSSPVNFSDVACPLGGTENVPCYQSFDPTENFDLYTKTPTSPRDVLMNLDTAKVRLRSVATKTGFGVAVLDNNGNNLGVIPIDSQVASENIARDFARRRFLDRLSIGAREGVPMANAATERICPPPKPPKPSSVVKTSGAEPPKPPAQAAEPINSQGPVQAPAPTAQQSCSDVQNSLAEIEKLEAQGKLAKGATLGFLGAIGFQVGVAALKGGLTGAEQAAVDAISPKGLVTNAAFIGGFELLSLVPGMSVTLGVGMAVLTVKDIADSWAADVRSKNYEIAGSEVQNAFQQNPKNLDYAFNQFVIEQAKNLGGTDAILTYGRNASTYAADYVEVRLNSPEMKMALMSKLAGGEVGGEAVKIDQLLDLGIPDILKQESSQSRDVRDIIDRAKDYRRDSATRQRVAYDDAESRSARRLVMKDSNKAAQSGAKLNAILDAPDSDSKIKAMIDSDPALADIFYTHPTAKAQEGLAPYDPIARMREILQNKAKVLMQGKTRAQILADCAKKPAPSLMEQIGQIFAPATPAAAPQASVYSMVVNKPNYVFTVSPGGVYSGCIFSIDGQQVASVKKLSGDIKIPFSFFGSPLGKLSVRIACNEGEYSVNSFTSSPTYAPAPASASTVTTPPIKSVVTPTSALAPASTPSPAPNLSTMPTPITLPVYTAPDVPTPPGVIYTQ